MADAIVVLDSSDDEDETRHQHKIKQHKVQIATLEKQNQHRISPITIISGNGINERKRRTHILEDYVAPKRFHATTSPESSLSPLNANEEQRAKSTPILPLIANVETLTTPSATPPLQLLASPPRNISSGREKLVQSPPQDRVAQLNLPPKVEPLPSTTPEKIVKRIKPTTILRENDEAWLRQKSLGPPTKLDSTERTRIATPELDATTSVNLASPSIDKPAIIEPSKNDFNQLTDKKGVLDEKPPLEKEFEELLCVCRKADPSADMEKLIETKLIKYYYSVHPDFVKSRGFRKNVNSTIERIRSEPDLVYYNLKTVVDELNVRRKSKEVIVTNDENTTGKGGGTSETADASPVTSMTTGNKHTDEQIKKLNKALYVLTKRIDKLEQSEVDWDDEDSTYLQVERFKKRACQIYEKICDLTGESKNARRIVKKPINFKGTEYPVFNKTLQAYINRTKEFPDFFDVLRMLEHCNRQYDLKLANFEVKKIAQDAFIKVGKTLQSRRKTDLYEMVTHFTGNAEDPATSDPKLLAKLQENQKTSTKISEIIDKYARVQDDPEAAAALQKAEEDDESKEDGLAVNEENGLTELEKLQDCLASDESDEEDDENLDAHVDKLTQDNTIDISDGESDVAANDLGDDNNCNNKTDLKQNEDKNDDFPSSNEASKVKEEKESSTNKNTAESQLTENNNIKCNENNKTISNEPKPPHDRNSPEKKNLEKETLNSKPNAAVVVNPTITRKASENCETNISNIQSTKTDSSSFVAGQKIVTTSSNHRTIDEIVISDEE